MLLSALSSIVLWTTANAQGPGQVVTNLTIPPEPLADALNELAQQSGLQVLFQSELVAQLRSPEVKGSLTVDEALQRLLARTGLRFEFVNPHTVTILAIGSPLPVPSEPKPNPKPHVTATPPDAQTSASSHPPGENTMPRRNVFARLLGLFAVCGSAAYTGGPCAAAEAPTSPAQLEEVTVTARRVTENVQEVPESMTVLTGTEIAAAGITSINDVANQTPNVIFDSQPVPGAYNFTVRGITMAQGAEAPVAMVVDGVELPDPLFINQELLNIDKVQVLRGPQGSLYGRNALAGAIVIDTEQPSNAAAGSVTLRYGNGDDRYANGILSGAVAPGVLFGSLAASTDHFAGLIDNKYLPGLKADTRADDNFTGRLVYKPTEALTISARVDLVILNDHVDTIEIVSATQFQDYSQSFVDENAQPVSDQHLFQSSIKVDYDFGFATATSISAYYTAHTDLIGDADFTPQPILLQDTKRNVTARSEELRLVSNPSSALKWVVGAFYQSRDTLNGLVIPFDNGHGQPAPVPPLIASHDEGTSRAWAVFGQATKTVLPATDLTLGLRYDSDARTSVDADFPGSAIAKTYDAVQPKASLEYHWTSDWQSYATVARGFRSGGFNAFFSVGAPTRGYGQETDWNYEIGFKGTFLNRTLSFDGAIYHTDVNNDQLFFINTNPPSQNVTTIDKVSINGGELELAAEPAAGFHLTAGVGIADSKIDQFNLAPATTGNTVPLSPTYSANLSADYVHRLGSTAWSFAPYVGITRRGPIWWDSANTLSTPPKDLLDVRLPLQSDHFAVIPYARNLLNQQYPTGASVNAFGLDRNGRFLSEPRTYGIEMRARF